MTRAIRRHKRRADFFARILNSAGYFRGKARLANFLGHVAYQMSDLGTFPLPDGKTATIDLGDRIQRLMWAGAYEPKVRACITALLRSGDTFIDVGAHIGFFSLLASSQVGPTGAVYAFEADFDLFQRLQANGAPYPWLVCYWRAVCSRSGPVSFSNPRQPGESGWGKLAAVRDEGHIVSVQGITLDEWHASVGFPPIRLIKIDAEGAEPFILDAAPHLLASARPFLILEVNHKLLREVGRPAATIIESLRRNGYRVLAISSDGLDQLMQTDDPSSTEILCVPSDRFDEAKSALGGKLRVS
jgi:FkbM family methyltransferase